MFNKLRTDRQLGYIVSMGSAGYGPVKGMKSMRGFTARILSNRYSPPVMQRELEIFLREMEGIMALSTEESREAGYHCACWTRPSYKRLTSIGRHSGRTWLRLG